MKKLLPYIAQGILAAIIGGLLITLMMNNGLFSPKSIIEIREVSRQAPDPNQATTTQTTSYADAVARATPAVVNIYTTKKIKRGNDLFFNDPFLRRFLNVPRPQQKIENSLGSGVIISEQGYLLTNNHVITEADEILVALNDGRTSLAHVVGTDAETDIAVLKIELGDLTSITMGHSESSRVGDVVLAIGNPFGVGQAVSQGIISATGRNKLGISTFEDFIQTDAAINPGNSGGALINAYGELIGINTAIYSRSGGSQGIGFAIPIDLAKNIMKQIVEQGHAVRGWLGIGIQGLTPALAESFGLDNSEGVIITGVMRNGPAHEAGIETGDIITHINNEVANGIHNSLLLITNTRPGDTLELTGVRNGEAMTWQATAGSRPPQK